MENVAEGDRLVAQDVRVLGADPFVDVPLPFERLIEGIRLPHALPGGFVHLGKHHEGLDLIPKPVQRIVRVGALIPRVQMPFEHADRRFKVLQSQVQESEVMPQRHRVCASCQRAFIVRHGVPVLVRARVRTTNLAGNRRVLRIQLERPLEGGNGEIRRLNADVRFCQKDVVVDVVIELDQCLIALGVGLSIVTVREVDVGLHHLCFSEAARTGLDVGKQPHSLVKLAPLDAELGVGDHDAHFFGRAGEDHLRL
mmetsp:Transcript_5094/g.20331  ORF Transcript_5094/g.20331 Transcript_5094/m.20331 type:complete len:254 (+) Transcript_5094:1408-2169(+)